MVRPVKRIPLSDKDRRLIETLGQGRPATSSAQPANYANRVVLKPWGYEFLVYENPLIAVWFLHIRKDHSTSMHCHVLKQTSLTLLSGKALSNTFRNRKFLSAGDSWIMEPGVFHSTKSVSLDGISLIEVETPSNKTDLLRLEDGYGRKDTGYEGTTQMVTEELARFDHFQFDERHPASSKFMKPNVFSIALEVYQSAEDFQRRFRPDPGALYCVCRGHLQLEPGGERLGAGDLERGAYLQQKAQVSVRENATLMKIQVFD
jgi:quercetin dioxygenase-like cupin family protein